MNTDSSLYKSQLDCCSQDTLCTHLQYKQNNYYREYCTHILLQKLLLVQVCCAPSITWIVQTRRVLWLLLRCIRLSMACTLSITNLHWKVHRLPTGCLRLQHAYSFHTPRECVPNLRLAPRTWAKFLPLFRPFGLTAFREMYREGPQYSFQESWSWNCQYCLIKSLLCVLLLFNFTILAQTEILQIIGLEDPKFC